MKRRSVSLLSLLVVLGSVSLLAGCNTAAGVGQDVSSSGQAVTHTADQVKNKL